MLAYYDNISKNNKDFIQYNTFFNGIVYLKNKLLKNKKSTCILQQSFVADV